MPRDRRDEIVLANLPDNVAGIFDEVQLSSANHDKNCVNLYKFHDQAREITKETRGGGIKVVGERAFQKAFLTCVFKTLNAKKGDVCADRTARFVGAYLKYVNEKAHDDHQDWVAQGIVDEDTDHYGTRFTEGLLTELIPGFDTKDKTVRQRVLLVMSHMTKHLGYLNFNVHQMLKEGLVERTNDREPTVRSLAVTCIAQVYAKYVPDDTEDEDAHPGRDILLDVLPREPSSEVRKAILNNVKLDPVCIPHVVRQARDSDTNIRKLVYGQVLKKAMTTDVDGASEPGPAHPTLLSLSDMESIIKKGLRDREDGPRQAAASLVNEWVKIYEQALPKPEPDQTYHAEVGVISLLERFNIIERRTEDLEVVEILLESIFSSRKDIADGLDFGEENWRRQGPENAIISRVFIQYCKKTKKDAKLEDILPVNRDMKDIIEGYYNLVLDVYDSRDEDTKVPVREIQAREFILGEMLKIAELLDYSDRFGALQILSLMKDRLLSENRLPEHMMPLCLDVLRQVANNEQDYIRIIVQLIQDLRGSEPPGLDEDEITGRCLKMCIHSLERVTSTYAENSSLRGILEELVLPCTSHEDPDIQRDAVTCIAMCSLITKPMAAAALSSCLSSVKSDDTPPDTKIVLYKTVFDLLMTYGKRIFTLQCDSPITESSLEKDLREQLGREDDLSALTVLCEGVMKLILTDFINTPQVLLINLFKVFIWPQTQHHANLLQRLQYFFEMYSVSSPKHQRMMQQIFVEVLKETSKERMKLPEDEEIITSAKVCMAFEKWTDPFELEDNMKSEGMNSTTVKVNFSIHLDLAHEILVALFEKTEEDRLQKDDKKALYQLLPRLHLPDDADGIKVVDLKLLIDTLKKCHPPTDAPSKKAFEKFEVTFTELYAAQLESFSEEDYREYEALDDLFKFLDDIIPDDNSILDEDRPMTRGQKRRSRSSAASSTGVDDEDISRRRKRPRYSTGTEDGQSTRNGTPVALVAKMEPVDEVIPAKPSRPRTSGPPPPGAEVIEISSDEDDEPAPPPRPKPKPIARYRGSKASTPAAIADEDEDEDVQEEDIVDLSRRLRASASLSTGTSAYTTSANVTKDSLFSSCTTRANATKDSLFSSFTASANLNTTKDSLFTSDSEEEEDEVSEIIAPSR